MDMTSIQKTPEQQIDEAVESLKALFLSQARNQQEADEIRRRLDSLGMKQKLFLQLLMTETFTKPLSIKFYHK